MQFGTLSFEAVRRAFATLPVDPGVAPLGRLVAGSLERGVLVTANPSRDGYWLVAADGGVFAFGGAPYDGSLGGSVPPHQVVGIVATANGYALVDQDGASTTFGS